MVTSASNASVWLAGKTFPVLCALRVESCVDVALQPAVPITTAREMTRADRTVLREVVRVVLLDGVCFRKIRRLISVRSVGES